MFLEYLVGLLCAIPLLIYSHRLPLHKSVRWWASALIIAAVVYVGFAVVAADWEWLPIEVLSVLIYAIPAVLAIRHSPWWLVVGWASHVAWDIGLHAGGYPGFVPHWYPGVCIGFDWAVAGYWIWRLKNTSNKK